MSKTESKGDSDGRDTVNGVVVLNVYEFWPSKTLLMEPMASPLVASVTWIVPTMLRIRTN